MADKPIGPSAPRAFDVSDLDPRLGGPSGLYDSPNYDRNTAGGIIQRVRVPAIEAPEPAYPFDLYSLNDSDTESEVLGLDQDDDEGRAAGDLASGTPYRRAITGSKM